MPINSFHPEYARQEAKWKRCRDAYEGSDAVKAAGTKYLPELKGQDPDEYAAYKDRALFYGATERTVQGLTGAAISKPFVYNVAPALKYLEDSSSMGTWSSLPETTKLVVSELLIQGRGGLLVDRPPGEGGKPYLAQYSAEQIINWYEEEGVTRQVVLYEVYTQRKADDPYVQEEKKRYRELLLDEGGNYIQRVHTLNAAGTGYDVKEIQPSQRGSPLKFIPFVVGSPKGLGWGCVKPPLLALVDVNLSHYRNSADLEHGRHFTGLPQPWVAGGKSDKPMRIGSSLAWVFDDHDAKVGFLEFSGQGLGALVTAQNDKERQMAILGARLLEGQRPGVEAADTVRMRQMGDVFTLASINESAAEMIQLALRYAEIWEGGTGEMSEVEPNTDFVDASLGAQEITALLAAVNAGKISLKTFLWNLKRGERLSGEIEEEEKLIEEDKANAPDTLPTLTPEERAALGLAPVAPPPGFTKPKVPTP